MAREGTGQHGHRERFDDRVVLGLLIVHDTLSTQELARSLGGEYGRYVRRALSARASDGLVHRRAGLA